MKAHNEERLAIKNGTNIKSIEKFWYTGKVYNLEVDIDHTYVGKGIIYHNSDVTIGRILPKWTNPRTGDVITSHVDDKGWYIVAEIRDDVDIADKVWEEVEKGTIRSFSIAGSSKQKEESYENGRHATIITKLDIFEVTLCLCSHTKITVQYGFKNIEDIKVGDIVLTHTGNYRKVTNTFKRNINEKILTFELENGRILKVTKNHLILTKNRGWIRAGDLTVQDSIGIRIISIKETLFEGEVFNIEVEEDNTYYAEGIIVHNCEEPVNPMSKFEFFYNPNEVMI
jgi:hypothetical protein